MPRYQPTRTDNPPHLLHSCQLCLLVFLMDHTVAATARGRLRGAAWTHTGPQRTAAAAAPAAAAGRGRGGGPPPATTRRLLLLLGWGATQLSLAEGACRQEHRLPQPLL